MYQQHFGLAHAPLDKAAKTLWKNEALNTLKTRFQWTLETPGIGLLTGEPGVGKTAALRSIVQSLNPHQYQVTYLAETDFGRLDIYRQLAKTLGVEPAYRRADLWRSLKRHITDLVEHKRTLPVLIIDEAQNLPHIFFRDFPAFLNFAFDTKDYLTVWFVGLPYLNAVLNRQIYETMSSRILVRYQLEPIDDREQFKQLITHALKEAGVHSALLTDSGIDLLRVASQGRMRHVQGLLVLAMRLAQQQDINHLPDDIIQKAIQELKG